MMFTLALRSLLTHPVRTAVLAGGFGLGVSVMAALLGIGGVILEQARAPALVGGGDVIVGGATGKLTSARFVLSSVLGSGPLAGEVTAVSPTARANLYLIDKQGALPIGARGGIPSLEQTLRDPETSGVAGWSDTEADRSWSAPDAGSVLRAMDRFHPIPDVPARAASWAEWLYFNGGTPDARFYMTFLAGPRLPSGRRLLGVRLQLERSGVVQSYLASSEIDEAELLATAPDLTIGPNRVRLTGQVYTISLDFAAEQGRERVSGVLSLHASSGRSMPPFTIRGAGGWLSGYTVPVMSGRLEGSLRVGDDTLDFGGSAGYHDHNWGFWEGVRWQWGQIQGDGLSFVYGRVYPPADAADASRIPGFLAALGPDGPVGFTTDVVVKETDDPVNGQPRRILIRGRSESLTLDMDLAIQQQTTTKRREGAFDAGLDFLQLRAVYTVTGRVGGRDIKFTAPGSAETFRGREP